MGKENPVSKHCINYFSNESREARTEAFTRLWTNVINQKENRTITGFYENNVLHKPASRV